MIIVLADQGENNVAIARRTGLHVRTVRTWRSRFAENSSIETLEDRPRSGRPARVGPEVRAELIKLACARPSGSKEHKALLFREVWTYGALADALEEETGTRISESEIGRILRSNKLRPHRVRMWLHSPDPNFATKVRRVCKLYCDPPAGAVVLCIDEKSILAREHKYAMRAAGPGWPGRREFEYIRHGTCVLLAAFDVATGKVFGQVRLRRTANDLVMFMESVAAHYEGREIYVIWDNLNIHHEGPTKRWSKFNERHGRFHFVYTPIHASWTNQVEIWFSILHRRVLKYGSFASVIDVMDQVDGFMDLWNDEEHHPFNWTFRGEVDPARKRAA
jgi:transposase